MRPLKGQRTNVSMGVCVFPPVRSKEAKCPLGGQGTNVSVGAGIHGQAFFIGTTWAGRLALVTRAPVTK